MSAKTDKSDLSYYIYLRGQVLERMGYNKQEILKDLEEAVLLEESVQEEGKKRSQNLAQLYKVKGALLEFTDQLEDAKKCFTTAAEIYDENEMEKEAQDLEKHCEEIDTPGGDIFKPREIDLPEDHETAADETESESEDEVTKGNDGPAISKTTLGVLGGALTLISAYAFYKARAE